MAVTNYRLHVGNVPNHLIEDDLVNTFEKYGKVNGVDIKYKKEACTNNVLSTFCFVDLETDSARLNKCLNKLDGLQWDDHHLKVSLAKESFLQRLQREREAAQNAQSATSRVHQLSDLHSVGVINSAVPQRRTFPAISNSTHKTNSPRRSEDLFSQTNQSSFQSLGLTDQSLKLNRYSKEIRNKRKSGINEENRRLSKSITHSHETPSGSLDVLKKLESFSDVWKDSSDSSEETEAFQDVLQSDSEGEIEKDEGINGRETDKELENPLDGYKVNKSPELVNPAEERRKKSLAEKKKTFELQKKAVQLALSDGNASHVNKKIVFEDEDDDSGDKDSPLVTKDVSAKEKQPPNAKGMILFGESDDEVNPHQWGDDFKIKKQFEGTKGKKLLNLQSRFNNDDRFTMDERFLEEDDKLDSAKAADEAPIEENEMAAEREQQFQILSDVLGQPISASKTSKESSSRPMVRFDPTKPNHSKYEVSKEMKKGDSSRNKKNSFDIEKINKRVQRKETEPGPVSKETFYEISDSLTAAFKVSKDTKSSEFSLLQLFGPSVDTDEKKDVNYTDNKHNHKEVGASLKLSTKRNLRDFGNFVDDEEGETDMSSQVKKMRKQNIQEKSRNSYPHSIIQPESFFFQPDDDRLKEGDDFFTTAEEEPMSFQDFKRKQRELRHLVNRKIQKNVIRASAFKTKLGGRPKPRPLKAGIGRSRGRH